MPMTDLLKELDAVAALQVARILAMGVNIPPARRAAESAALRFVVTRHAEIAEAVKSKTCAWTQDEFDGSWDTACGNKHQFTDGSPADNEHAFCPYCGGKLEVGDAAMHNSAREDG